MTRYYIIRFPDQAAFLTNHGYWVETQYQSNDDPIVGFKTRADAMLHAGRFLRPQDYGVRAIETN